MIVVVPYWLQELADDMETDLDEVALRVLGPDVEVVVADRVRP